ncbi:MAG: hypothetical protein Q8R76_06070 [Candidatus Omnitrophota bacterium]|nr:hypothetical protein [Candidatus Omnitrophota bacterium]
MLSLSAVKSKFFVSVITFSFFQLILSPSSVLGQPPAMPPAAVFSAGQPEVPVDEPPQQEKKKPKGAEEAPADFFSPQTLSSPDNPPFGDGFDIQELIDLSLCYFVPANGLVESTSGYPFEGFRQTDFTQPTAIGFYAQLLSNVISGDLQTEHMSKADAIAGLDRLTDSLLVDQENLGYKGLLPWMGYDGTNWNRKNDLFGQQVVLGDNANLSVALGATAGALSDESLAGDATVQGIKDKIDAFLEGQREGYEYLFNPAAGRFRRGWNFTNNSWVGGDNGTAHFFGDEFRQAILFLSMRYDFPETVYTSLETSTTEYTLSTGEVISTVMPFDGGAFQMLWPTLTMPETNDPRLKTMLRNFVTIALDHAKENNLPGFLSASYGGIDEYVSNAGITELSFNPAPRNETIASLYTLGAAYMIAPNEIEVFLEQIFQAHPDLITNHGLWEGVNVAAGEVIQEQIVANVSTFVLGLIGKGPEHMTRYLQEKGLAWKLEAAYRPEELIDIIADSNNAFSWGGGFITAGRSDDEYHITANRFNFVGTAFLHDGINIAGKTLRIKYWSDTAVGSTKIEFKERRGGQLDTRLVLDEVRFADTNGEERVIEVELPASVGLFDIDETVITINSLFGAGLSIGFTDFDIVPTDFKDLVSDGTGAFSWGSQITGYPAGDEYVIQSPAFTTSGTAFLQGGIDVSGGQLKLRYRSTTDVGNMKLQFKERTESGLEVRLDLINYVLENTGGAEREILIDLPVSEFLEHIDEIVMLLTGGAGNPLDLVITDIDMRQYEVMDALAQSQNIFIWGDQGVSGFLTNEGYTIQSAVFHSAGAAFIQPDFGINVAGKDLKIRYKSTTAVGKVKFELKERSSQGLEIMHVTEEVLFVNTGGEVREVTVNLPLLLDLFNLHELVMLITEGAGTPLDMTITGIEFSDRNESDLISESTGSFSWSNTNPITGFAQGDEYHLSSPWFYSSGTALLEDSVDLSGRALRLTYKSTTDVGTLKLEFKTQTANGVEVVYTIDDIELVNTGGDEYVIVINLPPLEGLMDIDEILFLLSDGTGGALDLTILDFDIL